MPLDKLKFYLLRIFKNDKLYHSKNLRYTHMKDGYIHFSDLTFAGKTEKISEVEFPEFSWIDEHGDSFKRIVTLG